MVSGGAVFSNVSDILCNKIIYNMNINISERTVVLICKMLNLLSLCPLLYVFMTIVDSFQVESKKIVQRQKSLSSENYFYGSKPINKTFRIRSRSAIGKNLSFLFHYLRYVASFQKVGGGMGRRLIRKILTSLRKKRGGCIPLTSIYFIFTVQ